jgi:hypothetical protein
VFPSHGLSELEEEESEESDDELKLLDDDSLILSGNTPMPARIFKEIQDSRHPLQRVGFGLASE